MLSLTTARILLGVYALLLGIGGLIGYQKAGSRPSLIAGGISALLAVAIIYLTTINPALGLALGLLLALHLAGFFGYRAAKARKFMPAGLLATISILMMLVCALAF